MMHENITNKYSSWEQWGYSYNLPDERYHKKQCCMRKSDMNTVHERYPINNNLWDHHKKIQFIRGITKTKLRETIINKYSLWEVSQKQYSMRPLQINTVHGMYHKKWSMRLSKIKTVHEKYHNSIEILNENIRNKYTPVVSQTQWSMRTSTDKWSSWEVLQKHWSMRISQMNTVHERYYKNNDAW